jgi:hypothetical protein
VARGSSRSGVVNTSIMGHDGQYRGPPARIVTRWCAFAKAIGRGAASI